MNKKINFKNKWVLLWVFGILLIFILLLPYIPLPFGLKIRLLTTMGMSHKGAFNKTNFDIYMKEYMNLSDIPYENGFEAADLVIISTTDRNFSVGDIISYPYNPPADFKIHRIAKYNGTHFTTLPDNWHRDDAFEMTWIQTCDHRYISWGEDPPAENEKKSGCKAYYGPYVEHQLAIVDFPESLIEGKVILRIPNIGLLQILVLCSKQPRCEYISCLLEKDCYLMEVKK